MRALFAVSFFMLTLLGWAQFFSKILKTELGLGIANATAFAGLIMFFGFLIALPQPMAMVFYSLGAFFFVLYSWKNRLGSVGASLVFPGLSYLILGLACLCLAYGIKFRSIDEYVFWGIMSKYLFVFQSLPHKADFIDARFLTYTPIFACFHYLIFTLAANYSQVLGYSAQNFIFIAALVVFADHRHPAASVCKLSVMLMIFFIGYGNVFARMEADAFVAAYFFICTWIIYKQGPKAIFLVFLPLLFLSLCKEIGLIFALFLVLCYVVLEKPKGVYRYGSIAVFISLLLVKYLWVAHTRHYGFHPLSAGLSWREALQSLNPWHAGFHRVQLAFIKAIFFSKFDRLVQMPYLLVYFIMAGLWYFLTRVPLTGAPSSTLPLPKLPLAYARGSDTQFRMPRAIRAARVSKRYSFSNHRINLLMGLFLGFTLVYLLMLYWLQALVYSVANYSQVELLDFARYYSMVLLPWLSLLIFIGLDNINPQLFSKQRLLTVVTVSLSLVFVGAGKIERMRKSYRLDTIYPLTQAIQKQAQGFGDKPYSICLLDRVNIGHALSHALRYFFMPAHVYLDTDKDKPKVCDVAFQNNLLPSPFREKGRG